MRASGTTIFSNADAPMSDRAPTLESMTEALRKRYGDALQVERYASGAGPAYGSILAEVYGGKGNLA